MRKLQFILASCTLVLSLAYAIAGVEVINFPVGESLHSVPNAVLLKQLQVRDASPASGTVSIGEITDKWETASFDKWNMYLISAEGATNLTRQVPWNESLNHWKGYLGGEVSFSNGTWNIIVPLQGVGPFHTNLNENVLVIEIPYEGGRMRIDRESADPVITPHATTNALWTLTAAGGSAVTNFPANSYEYLKPGIDWVRYGTATGGFVRLFVED